MNNCWEIKTTPNIYINAAKKTQMFSYRPENILEQYLKLIKSLLQFKESISREIRKALKHWIDSCSWPSQWIVGLNILNTIPILVPVQVDWSYMFAS